VSAAAALLLAGLLAAPAPGQVPAVAGAEQAVFLLTHPHALPALPDHRAAGYRQEVVRRDERTAVVRVSVEARPLRSAAPWPLEFLPEEATPYLSLSPPAAELAKEAAGAADGSPDAHAASARLVALAGRRVREVEDPTWDLEQDAAAAWRSGRGTCVGRANVAVALLRGAGIPARTAHGIRFEAGPGRSEEVSSRLLHRWVEVFLPDRGWVPSDPAASIHHLDSSYILLSLGGERPSSTDQALRGLRVKVLSRHGKVRPADAADPAVGLQAGDPPLLPNGAGRVAAALEVTAPPGTVLVLEGAGGVRRGVADGQGGLTFVGLEPGLHRLREERGRFEALLLLSEAELVRARVP